MRIAIVPGIFFPEPGGAQAQTHNLANKLTEMGYLIDVYLNKKTNLLNNNYNILKINNFITSIVYCFRIYLNLDVSVILKIYLKKIIKEKNYKIWHFIFLNFKSLILINCLKDLDQKVIVTFQGADIQIDKNIKYGYRINKKYDEYLKKTLKNIDLFMCISNNIEKDVKDLNVPENKIIRTPNTVDLNKISQIKKVHSSPFGQCLNFITVARFAPKKKVLIWSLKF